MTVVVSIMAIVTAVALPRWGQSVERARVVGMQRNVEADIDLLRRLAVRRGQKIHVTYTLNSATLTLSPAQAGVLGNAAGIVNYATRFPDLVFSAIDVGGTASCDINLYGELVATGSGNPLTAALVTVSSGSRLQQCDLLASQGLVSIPTAGP